MTGKPRKIPNGADHELRTLSDRLDQLQLWKKPTQTNHTKADGVDRELNTLSGQLQQLQCSERPAQMSHGRRSGSTDIYAPSQPRTAISYYYFIRISPVALAPSDIQPASNTRDNFQLRAFLGPGGGITAELTRDASQTFVVPGQEGEFIVKSLHRYMETHGGRLFLYVRMPDNGGRLKETEENLDGLSAILLEYQESFEVMDVAWFAF